MKERVRQLEGRLIQASSAVECMGILIELADLHAATYRAREGLRCAREAHNIAKARGEGLSCARALAAAARCHYARCDYVSAVSVGLNAVDAFAERDLPGRSSVLQVVAQALLAVESYDLAEQVAERAAFDAHSGGDVIAEAGARTIWGSILTQRDRFAAARRQFREAGILQRRVGDKLMLKCCAASIAQGYRTQGNELMLTGDLARARLMWRQAIRVYRVAIATGLSYAEDALAYACIAECECRLERPEAALAAVREGLDYAIQSSSPLVLAHCHLWESQALNALGKLEAARRACECARNAAEQLDHDAVLAECLKAESRLNDLSGRFESAQDLETRAAATEMEREAFFSRIREEVAQLWIRHVQSGGLGMRGVA